MGNNVNIRLREPSVGVDAALNQVAKKLYRRLSDKFGDGLIYSRCEIYDRDGETYPVFFDNGNYIEVLQDNSLRWSAFCLADQTATIIDNTMIVQPVSIIFQLNLNKIYNNSNRSDAAADSEIIRCFSIHVPEIDLNQKLQRINDVYSEFAQDRLSSLEPYYNVRFNGSLSYTTLKC